MPEKKVEIDTIAAQATSPGRAGIGIIRISGPKVKQIARQILGIIPDPRYAHFSGFLDNDKKIIDQGLALYFPAPNSFTGEDVLELHGHGVPVIMDCVLRRVLELGARLANPGEFSERAFLNGKIDLAQAESIADLINASSTQAAHSAMRSLQGEFSRQINSLSEEIINLRTYVEAAIDFSDQEIDYISTKKINQDLKNILQTITKLQKSAEQGVLLQEGLGVVIVGKPNVGKSSLLNYFCGRDAAIVTHIPGTTRDILREYINIDGLPLHIIDTAGLRETFDLIEQEGIKRVRQEMQRADFILLMVDEDDVDLHFFKEFLDKIIVVRNKIDLTKHKAKIAQQKIYVSVKTGAGLNLLKDCLKNKIGFNASESDFMARRRHLDALQKAYQLLSNSRNKKAFELLAEDLCLAHRALGEITGAFYPDDLLGKIFSEFCIGK
jgi:tRNA modification GTPase